MGSVACRLQHGRPNCQGRVHRWGERQTRG
nr:MAG TPA: hypothetical protein [Caudoviricetes sp.]